VGEELQRLEELYRQEIASYRFLINTLLQKVTLLSQDVQVLIRTLERDVEDIRNQRRMIREALMKKK